jgi:hypothetical protein
MILLGSVVVGLVAGLARARIQRLPYQAPELKLLWLVFLAFIMQWLAFRLPVSWMHLNSKWAAAALVSSQIALLVFAWANRKQPAFWLLGIGLLLNLVVIVANGGLMPITPETVAHLTKAEPGLIWQVGERLGTGKDIVLNAEATRLWFLSDRFLLLPDGLDYQVAFSLGDVLIAGGAFWLLFSPQDRKQVPVNQAFATTG